jgi:hypothetical protein
VECNPAFCPAGLKCENQRIRKQGGPKLEVKRAGSKGWGLFACEDVSKGSYVCTYIGEVGMDRLKRFKILRAVSTVAFTLFSVVHMMIAHDLALHDESM